MADQDDQIKDENLNEEGDEIDQSQEDAQEEELQEEEEQQEEQQEEELEEDDQDDDQQEEKQERGPSRREQLRVADLLRKYPNGRPSQNAPQQDGIDYSKYINADDEVYEQLGQVSRDFGTQQYLQGVREAEKVKFETRLEIDAPRVESKYPQLDKNSQEFNPAVAHAVNSMYLSAVGYDEKTGYVDNPNLRYSEYAEAIFELVNEAADRKTETTRRNVTKQASRTAIRPDGSTARTPVDLSKDPTAMSDKELDTAMAKLGLAPKR